MTVALTIFFLSSCASLTGNMDALEYDVKNLKAQVATINAKLQDATTKLSKLESQESTVTTVNALRESQADINSKFSKLSQEFKHISSRIDENKYNTGLSIKETSADREVMKAQLGTLETMVKELQLTVGNLDASVKAKAATQPQASTQTQAVVPQPQVVTQSKTPVNKSQKKDTTVAAVTTPPDQKDNNNEEGVVADNNKKSSAKSIYESASKDCDAGFYKAARDKLYKLLKDEPKGAYAELSNFMIADTYYKEGSYEDAIIQYEEVLKKFPKSKIIPDALLKQGLSFIQLGGEQNIGTAKLIFKQLITKFPKSNEAVTAKDKLDSLTPKPKVKKKAGATTEQ